MLEWGDFLKIALTSSLFSAVVTTGANYYFKKQDYKRDYYKKIIDKRLKAYEELETFMGGFCLKHEVYNPILDKNEVKSFEVLHCFTYEDGLKKANTDLLEVLKHSLWFSDEISENLSKINAFVCEVGIAIEDPSSPIISEINKSDLLGKLKGDDLIVYMGHIIFDDMQKHLNALGAAINNDLKEMHNVEKFLSTRKFE